LNGSAVGLWGTGDVMVRVMMMIELGRCYKYWCRLVVGSRSGVGLGLGMGLGDVWSGEAKRGQRHILGGVASTLGYGSGAKTRF